MSCWFRWQTVFVSLMFYLKRIYKIVKMCIEIIRFIDIYGSAYYNRFTHLNNMAFLSSILALNPFRVSRNTYYLNVLRTSSLSIDASTFGH